MSSTRTNASWLGYQPSGRGLDVEVFHFSDLCRRGTPAQIRAPHRYAFYMLVCVTEGQVIQTVDFLPVGCASGSLLVLKPGQVHSLGSHEGWDGWMVLFRSEFLPSEAQTTADLLPALGLDRLPDHLCLQTPEFQAVEEAIARMQQDAMSDAPPADVHAMIRYQLCALLLRLTILHGRQAGAEMARSQGLQRFAKFRSLLEENYSGWHNVSAYARALGCTEKSLTRAALEATGKSAKSVIASRIALEAKRLLAHSNRPIYLISEGLGFMEATNFAKFFKRETGLTPVGFRRSCEW
ncbi:Transcriptional regulator PobR [Neorhizobium galegae bv. officinalis]|uniref:Transcriptional regulator PobR n=1 Tax=Neorhizobium galegae bv. officinalis TaxID=323656 RepID=A0A0T7FE20_NEOGA|nr:helix-turn-helix transcriptional regulator [Neorhizobium galegae]CDZ33179.1 Transcriptional regulator PobR [Neorhizobium galegae bv. officinalis]